MTNVPVLSVLWLLPLVGAVVIIAIPPGGRQFAKWLGVAVSVAVLAVSIVLALAFKAGGPIYQFTESHPWIPAFGAGYTIGVDGIALMLVLVTTILVPFLLVAGWNDGDDADDPLHPAAPRLRSSDADADDPLHPAAPRLRSSDADADDPLHPAAPRLRSSDADADDPLHPAAPRLRSSGAKRSRGTQAYVALTLTIESMVLISVVSLDVLLFYVFFEAMLIPMYFLIGGFGDGAHRSRAAVKFLLYNLVGGLIMLAAVIGLYVVTAKMVRAHSISVRSSPPSPRARWAPPRVCSRRCSWDSCSRSPSRRRCGRSTVGCPTPRLSRHRRLRC